MACDICGNNERTLVDIRDIYQTDNVKQVCPDCEKMLSDHLSNIKVYGNNLNTYWFKKFMETCRVDQLELKDDPTACDVCGATDCDPQHLFGFTSHNVKKACIKCEVQIIEQIRRVSHYKKPQEINPFKRAIKWLFNL